MDCTDCECKTPADINHDIREPWPLDDDSFDVVIALRVWHHLAPRQMEALFEALRVAKHVIIACPEDDGGILRCQWPNPTYMRDLGFWGMIYRFDR
jgi:SAM-dependent methyltransferase